MKKKQFVMLSGLPRTGSTLLSAILNQNPKIHSEGYSALLPYIYTIDNCSLGDAKQHLQATKRFPNFQFDLVSSTIDTYYKNVKKPIIVDKCRVWTRTCNMNLIYKYITEKPKVIVLRRKMEEIVKSFLKIYRKNNRKDSPYDILHATNTHIYLPIAGIEEALNSTKGEFLFINYEDIITDPIQTLKKIYDFCEWEYFSHNLNNIVHEFPEDDSVYELEGFHKIRPVINKLNNNIQLPTDILDRCNYLNKIIGI